MTNNALKPCEYCDGSEYMYYAEDHGTIACVEIVGGTLVADLYRDYAEMPIKFCPMCGRKLEEPPCNTKTP